MIPRGLPLALVLALVACGEPAKSNDGTQAKPAAKADDPAQPAQPEAETPASGDALTLGDAKIMRAGHEDRAIEIKADGSVTLAGAPYAKLSSDGTMTSPSGDLMMRVQTDGTVVSDSGPTGMKLGAKGGELSMPSLQVEISFGDDGTIATRASGSHAGLLNNGAPPLVSSGCDGAMLRTCSLITLSYLSALGNPDSVQQDEAPPPG